MTQRNQNFEGFEFPQGLTWDLVTHMVKAYQAANGLEPDGIVGPLTIATAKAQTEPPLVGPGPKGWPVFHGPIDAPLANRRDAYKVLGNPGAGKADQQWVKENIIECHVRYGNKMPGVPEKYYFQVHRLAEPFVREGLRRAVAACPEHRIVKAASFVFRHMRHDPSMPLSDHAFAAAIDINPAQNSAKYFKRGEAPKPWTQDYYNTWPNGLPREFVEAMKSVGFVWGSDWDNDGDTSDHTFLDPMHFTLVKPG